MKVAFKKFTALLMVFLLILVCFGCSSDFDKGYDNEKEDVEYSGNTDSVFAGGSTLAGGNFHTVGVKSDGTVVTSYNS